MLLKQIFFSGDQRNKQNLLGANRKSRTLSDKYSLNVFSILTNNFFNDYSYNEENVLANYMDTKYEYICEK